MSAWKLIYLVFRRMAIPVALLGTVSTTGCSDATRSAMETGALAQSQLEAGQLFEARKTIRAAIEERDDIAELHLLRARIELSANSPANAFTAYSTALALDSTNLEALVGVAQIGLQVGRFRDSEDAADRILALDPTQKNGLIIKGWHNVVKRRLPEAIANAEAILATTPNDESAIILKSRALALQGKFDESFKVVQSIRTGTEDSRDVATSMLEFYRARDDGRAMLPLLERLRELVPEEVDHDIDEADTLYKLGEVQRARAILYKRIFHPKLTDKDAAAVTGVWNEYDPKPLNPAQLAEVAAKAGIPARAAVARLFLTHNDLLAAKAVLAGPSSDDNIVAMRALVGIAEGKVNEGLAQANAILERDRNHCDALVAKAQATAALGRADDAVTAGTQATTTCPKLVPAYLALVRAHELKKNEAGILVTYRDAFDHNDQDSNLTRRYTSWLVQSGRSTRALAIAQQLTNHSPSLLSAWKLYLDLCNRIPGAGCASEATAGLAQARHRFGVDPRSGEMPPVGLAARLNRK